MAETERENPASAYDNGDGGYTAASHQQKMALALGLIVVAVALLV